MVLKTREYITFDKADWSDGLWKAEPDRRQWLDEESGYPCLILRNPIGALCGYVGVPSGHFAYGKHFNVVDVDIRVHGGVTFASNSSHVSGGVYLEVDPGESEDVYWLGFHCGHMGDRCPRVEMHIVAPRAIVTVPGTYRDINYVTQECHRLAMQLKAMESAGPRGYPKSSS